MMKKDLQILQSPDRYTILVQLIIIHTVFSINNINTVIPLYRHNFKNQSLLS